MDELSKIYRYLLQANRNDWYRTGLPDHNAPAGAGPDHELTPLHAEIAFIESYVHLRQTRYGAGVNVPLAVCDDWLNSLLPPLTLQLLVENARNGGPCKA